MRRIFCLLPCWLSIGACQPRLDFSYIVIGMGASAARALSFAHVSQTCRCASGCISRLNPCRHDRQADLVRCWSQLDARWRRMRLGVGEELPAKLIQRGALVQ
jgi:hypothetical protein